jgi:hypothetical protein
LKAHDHESKKSLTGGKKYDDISSLYTKVEG